MAVVNLTATALGLDLASGKGEGASVKSKVYSVETNSDDSATSTYDFGDYPSNARILGISKASWDDVGGASATMDFGFFGSQITDDDDGLSDGNAVSSAGSAQLIGDIANYGKKAYEFVSGQSTDPKGVLTLKGTLKDAAIDSAGTITVEVYYVLD